MTQHWLELVNQWLEVTQTFLWLDSDSTRPSHDSTKFQMTLTRRARDSDSTKMTRAYHWEQEFENFSKKAVFLVSSGKKHISSLLVPCLEKILEKFTSGLRKNPSDAYAVFFSLCLFDLQLLFLNTCQKVTNGVGWPDDRHGLSPILYDTAPVFIYTDQLLCHCVFICSNFR